MPSFSAGIAGLSLLASLYAEISQPPLRTPAVAGPDGELAVAVLNEPRSQDFDDDWSDRLAFTFHCLREPDHPARRQAGCRLVAVMKQVAADRSRQELAKDHLGWDWSLIDAVDPHEKELISTTLDQLGRSGLCPDDPELLDWMLWTEDFKGFAPLALDAIEKFPRGEVRDAWLRRILAGPHPKPSVLAQAVAAYHGTDWLKQATRLLGHPVESVVLSVHSNWPLHSSAVPPASVPDLELPEYEAIRRWTRAIVPSEPDARLCRYRARRDEDNPAWSIGSLRLEESGWVVRDHLGLVVPAPLEASPLDPCGYPGFLEDFRRWFDKVDLDEADSRQPDFEFAWLSDDEASKRWNLRPLWMRTGLGPPQLPELSPRFAYLAGWLLRTGQGAQHNGWLRRVCQEKKSPQVLRELRDNRQEELHSALELSWSYDVVFQEALSAARALADPVNEGALFHARGKALARQIPGRMSELSERHAMPLAEWPLWADAPRDIQLEVLLALLPLRQWYGCENGLYQYSFLPESFWQDLYDEDLLTEEEMGKWLALDPRDMLSEIAEIKDLPVLSWALSDERYLHGFECWRNYILADRNAVTVNGDVSSLIHNLVGFDVCHMARAYSLDENGRARHWEWVTQFCHRYAASTPYDRLVFKLETQRIERIAREFQELTPDQRRAFTEACVKEHPHTVPALLGGLVKADLRPLAREVVNSLPAGRDPWLDALRPEWGGDEVR